MDSPARVSQSASDESISNLQAPAGAIDIRSDRGPSSFDIRYKFTGTASDELPAWGSSHRARSITGGFSIDSIVRLYTAAPVNLVTHRDVLSLGLANISRPDLVPG